MDKVLIMFENLKKYNIILGSNSPRRKELLTDFYLFFQGQRQQRALLKSVPFENFLLKHRENQLTSSSTRRLFWVHSIGLGEILRKVEKITIGGFSRLQRKYQSLIQNILESIIFMIFMTLFKDHRETSPLILVSQT